MFSALTQGSLIYILDKTDGYRLSIGEVIGVSAPRINYSQPGTTVVDLKINVDGGIQEFNQIPGNSNIVTYNNGKITLSETKSSLQTEVETILQNSKQVLDNISKYKQTVEDCENILKDLNPQFAKEKDQENRLSSLEEKFSGVENKIDKLLTLIQTQK